MTAAAGPPDRHELERLYQRYGASVLRRARRILGDDQAARDVCHDVFLEILRAPSWLPVSPLAWLYVATTNRCLNVLRSDRVIAYTEHPVAFRPYGPSDDPITLPGGYSILRRACGVADKPWRLELVDNAQPITFQPSILPNAYPRPRPPEIVLREQSEGLLLQGCGIERPNADLGNLLSFDRATSVMFTTDGAQLLYLARIDAGDPDRLAPLRSVDLASGAVRQVAAIRDAYRLQQTSRLGQIFVWTQTGIQRIDIAGDRVTRTLALPNELNVHVSPDGQWFAHYRTQNFGEYTPGDGWVLRNLDDGSTRLWEGANMQGWTPDSEVIVADGYDLVVVSPVDSHELRRFSSSRLSEFLWNGGMPYGLTAQVTWKPFESDFPAPFRSDRGFGLSVQGPGANDPVPVVDTSAGGIATQGGPGAIEIAARSADAAFVWTRKCLGLFETVCTFELHRVKVPAFEDRVVAVSAIAAPVAVSPAGDRIAIAAPDGVFVRSLPQ